MRELYRRNKSKGICWCSSIWDKTLLKVYLHHDGIIVFEYVESSRDHILTARPIKATVYKTTDKGILQNDDAGSDEFIPFNGQF